jgi:hypothetical protein
MRLKMWMYDLAREQAPTLDHLRQMLDLTRAAGFNAWGLYMEHRFAYPSTPWAHGRGAVTPDMVRTLIAEYPDIEIVPFLNLLGHFEGMLYTEEGKRFREALFQGMQACPSCPEFVDLCASLIGDVVEVFDSELIHIGGDETWQLGQCSRCQARFSGEDGKSQLYGNHFGPLARSVVERGRRPAVWGDMFLDHPEALSMMPGETVIFDWHYSTGAQATSERFRDAGHDVVCCPTLHVYNATWCHLEQSEANVREHVKDARAVGALGVCVTTWESALFGAYDTLFPALRACGDLLNSGSTSFFKAYEAESQALGQWAHLMSRDLQEVGGVFAFSGIRSSLKVRLLLNGNPFLAWLHHGEELSGPVGDRALQIIEGALEVAPHEAAKGVTLFARSAVEFVRLAEAARQEYASERAHAAALKLAPSRTLFDDLAVVAKRSNQRIGGSLADIERCRVAKEHVERVIARIKAYGDRSLGYLPAFEHLTHHKFMPHDQGAWWLINRWANE